MKPHPRFGHTICQWETEEKSLCVLVGGCSIRASGAVYVLDIDGCKAHKVCHNITVSLLRYYEISNFLDKRRSRIQ